MLAGFGADVLRIDPHGWDEPGVIPEVTPGKRCARLNLKDPADMDRLQGLLAQADVLVHGYRGTALSDLGLTLERRQAIRPGLIDISLNAYGHEGPWADRRGFDSLVQFSSGIAEAGMQWQASPTPVSLPVQALDHATGYLMAAAAIRGLIARRQGSGPIIARLSLARTARLLTECQTSPSTADMAPATDQDYAQVLEETDWGPAHRLKPPLILPEAELYWTRPAPRLGSGQAEWLDLAPDLQPAE
jgi:crotonobetainyl-CoA:carnitine CoA-transferase CaiB-like acyl-CoA transferase